MHDDGGIVPSQRVLRDEENDADDEDDDDAVSERTVACCRAELRCHLG